SAARKSDHAQEGDAEEREMTLALEHKRSSPRARAATRAVPQPGTTRVSTPPVVQTARACACGGSCPRCASASSITIGPSDDDFQPEPDAVANPVNRMPHA